MTKKSKRVKKRINSSIDDEYIDSYINRNNQIKADSLFKYDIIGKLSLKGSKLTETRKSKHFKNKNSPEIAKLKKLKKKLLLSDNMMIDADSTANTNDINAKITNNELNNLMDNNSNDKEVDDIWNDSIYKSVGKKTNKIKNINQLIPAVELPHPGQSYNPKPDDYLSLINHSVNIINLNKKDELPIESSENTEKNIFEGLLVNGLNRGSEEIVDELDSSNDLDDVELTPKRVQKRKTKTERNKIKVIKEENRKKMVIKSIKKLKNDVDHIKKLNTTINRINTNNKYTQKLHQFKNYLNKLLVGEVPTKIGNKTFYSDPPEVDINDQLLSVNGKIDERGTDFGVNNTINIKNIKAVDENPIKNVYKSIYRRGLLPPPPIINSSYKSLIKRLYSRRYVYKSVLTN